MFYSGIEVERVPLYNPQSLCTYTRKQKDHTAASVVTYCNSIFRCFHCADILHKDYSKPRRDKTL